MPPRVAAGMSVDASIIIAEKKDVLVLPKALVRARTDGTATVKVWANGSEEDREIKIGLIGDSERGNCLWPASRRTGGGPMTAGPQPPGVQAAGIQAAGPVVIETHDLTRTYIMGSSQVHALRSASFQVAQGEFVALMGPSGSGKSTLMHLLGCLDRPTSGQYILEGTSVDRMTEEQRARVRNRRIGFIFQNFNLLSRMTALENVGLPLLYGADDRGWQARAKQALRRVGLVTAPAAPPHRAFRRRAPARGHRARAGP